MKPKPLLSPKWRRRAQRLNPYYQRRLHWTPPDGWTCGLDSPDFAAKVAAFQKAHGLTVDGVLGPKTWEALRGKTWQPDPDNYLIAGGDRIPVTFPVVTWHHPDGLSFYEHRCWSWRHDRAGGSINLFVLHWDGCTSSHQCFQVLATRRLSAHLMLDGDGTVYQALDLAEANAWHCGKQNQRSIGVEIQNPVRVHRNQWQKPKRNVISESHIHGHNGWSLLDYYDIQKQRVVELAEVLCDRFAIPRELPLAQGGGVIRGLAPRGFRGVAGHYHFSKRKPDPGLSLWPHLSAAFYPTRKTKPKCGR